MRGMVRGLHDLLNFALRFSRVDVLSQLSVFGYACRYVKLLMIEAGLEVRCVPFQAALLINRTHH